MGQKKLNREDCRRPLRRSGHWNPGHESAPLSQSNLSIPIRKMGVGVEVWCLRAPPAPTCSWWSLDGFEREDSFDVRAEKQRREGHSGKRVDRSKGPEKKKLRAGVENDKERIWFL